MGKTSAPKPARNRKDGRVILHVFVEPDTRHGLHTLASHAGVHADAVLRSLVRRELKRKGIPMPAASSAAN